MIRREISEGQGILLTPELTVPEEVRVVVSTEEFEKWHDQQTATPGSVALQQALEAETRERQLDRLVDTTGVSYDEAERRLGFRTKGHGHDDFSQMKEKLRAKSIEYKNKQTLPPEDWRA